MNICNCFTDLQALFCDIPEKWKKGITEALCYVLSNKPSLCECFDKCETVTYLSPFTLNGSLLSISYTNEKGQIKTSSVDISDIIENVLDDVDPKCLMTQEEWDELSFDERFEAIITGVCTCCTTTTTSSTTTTTTENPSDFYNASEYSCLDGECTLINESVNIYVPAGTPIVLNQYYQGIDFPDSYYFIKEEIEPVLDCWLIDDSTGTVDCNSFCPTTTTTTTSSTTTTTTVPVTTTTTSSTSTSTSTTTSSTTTTTTETPTTTTTTSSSTTTTTTEAGITCNTYQVTGTPSIDIEWEDCGSGAVLTATTGGTLNICARTGTLVQTGGSGTIVDMGDCSSDLTSTTTTSSTTTTTTEETTTTTTTSSTTTTTTEEPTTTTTTSSTTTTTTEEPTTTTTTSSTTTTTTCCPILDITGDGGTPTTTTTTTIP